MNTEMAPEHEIPVGRRFALQVSILIAGTSTISVPIVVMAERHIFGRERLGNRMAVAGILAIIYTASYLIVRTTSLIAVSAGLVVTTAAIMTAASGVFAFIAIAFSSSSGEYIQTVWYAVCFLVFTVFSNVAFLVLSIRYVIAVRKEITVFGAIGGAAAALCLPAISGWLVSVIRFIEGTLRKL
jgi:hypothetical protein